MTYKEIRATTHYKYLLFFKFNSFEKICVMRGYGGCLVGKMFALQA